jgi:hypothetical protein
VDWARIWMPQDNCINFAATSLACRGRIAGGGVQAKR